MHESKQRHGSLQRYQTQPQLEMLVFTGESHSTPEIAQKNRRNIKISARELCKGEICKKEILGIDYKKKVCNFLLPLTPLVYSMLFILQDTIFLTVYAPNYGHLLSTIMKIS